MAKKSEIGLPKGMTVDQAYIQGMADQEEIAAFEQAVREDGIYQKGWDDSRDWYRDSFKAYLESYGSDEIELTIQVIDDIFNELPEDAMGLLYQAALNRGQP